MHGFRVARPAVGLLAAFALVSCQSNDRSEQSSAAATPTTNLTTERQRVSYMVGLDLAKNVVPIKDEVDIDIVLQALRSAHAGEKPLLDATQSDEVRKRFTQHLREQREVEGQRLAQMNRAAGVAFLADNAKKPGVISTASGLQYQVLRDAAGTKPKATDTVRVNYIGTLLDGRKFEDTWAIDHPASFALNQVLPGLGEAIQLMPVGSKYRFWIPANLGYAESGKAGEIEPNSTLVFEIELLEIAGS